MSVLNITSGCRPFSKHSVYGSDSMRETLSEFKCPFSRDEVVSLREEMEELAAWDERYFIRREQLFREMQDLVELVMHTGESFLYKAILS